MEIDKKFTEDLISKVEKSEKDLEVEKNEQIIIVKTLNAISKIPEILNTVENEGFSVVNVKITKQSLETVFISLTGKELRV